VSGKNLARKEGKERQETRRKKGRRRWLTFSFIGEKNSRDKGHTLLRLEGRGGELSETLRPTGGGKDGSLVIGGVEDSDARGGELENFIGES